MAEQIAGRNKGRGCWHDRLPLRHIGGDGCKQPGSGGDGFPRVDRNALGIGGIAIDYGQPGIEGCAAPCVGAPVDGDGKDGARRWIEALEGAAPGGIARDTAGRRDRHQPPARREHGEGGTEVAQIRVMTGALDPGARRKRRVHENDGGMQVRQIIGDGLRVVTGAAGDQRGALGEFVLAAFAVEHELVQGRLHHRQSRGQFLQVDPSLERARRQNDRHPVMDRGERGVRGGGENGEGLNRVAHPVLGERAARRSALALMSLYAMAGSLAQPGINPQRSMERPSTSASARTTPASWLGAML